MMSTNNNQSYNTTADTHGRMPTAIWLAILPIMIVLCNLLVLIVIIGDRKLRSTAQNKFIASHAVSDLLLAVLVLPVAVYVKVMQFYVCFLFVCF